jgi:hypothetical protein
LGLALSAFRKLDIRAGLEKQEEVRDNAGASWPQLLAFSLAAMAALALYYPWMRFVGEQAGTIQASEIANPKVMLRLVKELGDKSYPIAGLLLIGAVAGARALLRQGNRGAPAWLWVWFLVPIFVVAGFAYLGGYHFAIGYLLHATPPLVLLAGYGLSYVGEQLTILPELPLRISSPAILYAVVLASGSLWIQYVHAHDEPADWRGISTFLSATLRDGDAVAMPLVNPLVEYYNPALAAYSSDDMASGPGAIQKGSARRRIVVCYDRMDPDPCGAFRRAASKDPAWIKRQITGFTLFLRSD